MPYSILDILINEVANALGITPTEVKSKFTQEQLNDLLNNSLCTPLGDTGVPFASTEVPCDDLAVPDLLPQIDVNIEVPKSDPTKVQKCIDNLEETNKIIEAQIELYNQHRILLDKLVEYRDNYALIAIYYQERANEAARILGEFAPLIIELRRLETLKASLATELSTREAALTAAQAAYSQYSSTANQTAITNASNLVNATKTTIDQNSRDIDAQNTKLTTKEQTFPIFNNQLYRDVLNNLNNSEYIAGYLKTLYDDIFTTSEINSIRQQVEAYSEGVILRGFGAAPTNITEVFQNQYIKLDLQIPTIDYIRTTKEKFNKENGESYQETLDYLIRKSPLLEKTSFFENTNNFILTNFPLENRGLPTGTIYQNYYNWFEDPVNRFFSLEERGLTTNIALVDPNLKGTGSETKKENNADYYIQNINTLQNFYNEFDSRFEIRKAEQRAKIIDTAQNAIRTTMKLIAKREITVILALSNVNKFLPAESTTLETAIQKLNRENGEVIQKLADLDSEIARIKQRVAELKPDPAKIKTLLKTKSPECFDNIDKEVSDCSETKGLLGSDPFFTKTIGGVDPTLPNMNQMCYWIEFAKIATLVGLLPIPNATAPPQLRYWPVGLTIPYPGGLIKIPLPIIWIPLVAISTPLGSVVLFLTINGIFISPVVFFVSSTGFKQHILTVKGPSKQFGYTAEDASIKPGIQMPASLLAAKAKANRLLNAPNFGLSPEELIQQQRQQNILSAKEASANRTGNENQQAKVKREKANFEKAKDDRLKSGEEKLAELLDKGESVKDIIDDTKKSLLNRIDELGKPALSASNKLKDKIASRRAQLLEELKGALVEGNDTKIDSIRAKLGEEGVTMPAKIQAVKDDAMAYFDKLKFPKITIPKDTSTIDPKLNGIQELVLKVADFSSISGTQFFSKDDSKVQKLITRQIAKSKDKVKSAISSVSSIEGTIDLEKEPEKIKAALKKINKTLIDDLTGAGEVPSISGIQQEIKDTQTQLEKETDGVKKTNLRKKLQEKQVSLSAALEKDKIKKAFALTPAALTALSQVSVDFNPFASCCKKKPFELSTDLSPAIAIFSTALGLLNSYVDSMSVADLKTMFGGKTKISANDITGAMLGMVKKIIPVSLEIPLPALNLLTFATSFAAVLGGLFEPKAPNLGAQPALPTSVTIDLNLLKKPMINLLITFLANCLPDGEPSKKEPNASSPATLTGKNNLLAAGTQSVINNSVKAAKLDPNIKLINCEPDTSTNSAISSGQYDPAANSGPATSSGLLNPYQKATASQFSSSNVVVDSRKDILPNFQTLDIDFLNINPGDILVIIKNFIDLIFDKIEKLLEPFYTLLKVVKGLKGVNLNVLEAVQHKAPPYGPASEAIHLAITNLKKQIPKSATVKMINTSAVEAAAKQLETILSPVMSTPLPGLIVAGAGAVDVILPALKVPSIDTATGAISTKDVKATSLALRSLHPLLAQDDLPPWERLTAKNLLFLLFVDEFVANAADKVGFFRSFV